MGKRVSGSRMAAGEKYAALVDGIWRLDMDAVRASAEKYLEEAGEAGRYSLSGLCIALDITRETLDCWRQGFVCREDAAGAALPNTALAECIAKTMLHLQRYWEESGKPASLGLKLLEATGALRTGGQTSRSGPPFDMGRLKKYTK